jgi:ankyrin repeat protein
MDPFIFADQNQIDELKFFLNPYFINERDEKGNTILMIACRKGFYGLAKLCLEKGADRTITNNSGETAYQLVLESKNTLLLKLFL